MSAGAIFQEALRTLRRHALPETCERDVLAALRAARSAALALFYEAGHVAGLADPILLARAAALHFGFAAGNLADDLADGDCRYLDEPLCHGPGAQFVLQSMCFAELATLLPAEALAAFAQTLVSSAAQQQVEVRTREWTAARYVQVGEAIAGRQWAAYLGVLWHGTPLAADAPAVGLSAGIIGFVVGDVRSGDRRLSTLSSADRAHVIAWAREQLAVLRRYRWRFIEAIVADAEGVIPTE